MQQFTIPQFIDVEDKIIGPVTTRQFVIMLSGFLLIAICYKIFDFSLFLTVAITIFIISGIFAFIKINGRPFHLFVLNITQTIKRPGLRVWNKSILLTEDSYKQGESDIIEKSAVSPPKMYPTTSRLAELSLIVDTQGVYQGEEEEAETKIEALNKNSNLNNNRDRI